MKNKATDQTTNSFEILSRLHGKYIDPSVNLETTYTQLRSGMNSEALEGFLLKLGYTIHETRLAREKKYLDEAQEALDIENQQRKNKRAVKMTNGGRNALKNMYNFMELQDLQKGIFKSSKRKFEDIEADTQDFEMACMCLPEANPSHDRLSYLTECFDETTDALSDRLIGMDVLRTLSKEFPFASEQKQDIPNIPALGKEYLS